MKTVIVTLQIFFLMTLAFFARASEDKQIYEFTRNVSLSFPGKRLVGHVFEEFSTKKQVIHCAYECLKSSRCHSFNYKREFLVCQLNDGDHLEFNGSLVTEVNGTSYEYHHREAFGLEKEALGPCAEDPCENGGRCLDTVNWKMERTYFCICTDEWMGYNCETQKNRIDWDDWEEWGTCSVTCETGWTTRRRRCMDVVTGETMSSSECYGREVEYQSCTLQSCPRWLEWSQWDRCSTDNTCGQGTMQRYRNCSNGGIPGKDRYCLGFTTETAPCRGINCRGMLTINDIVNHGDGRIEIFNDFDGIGMSICADSNWTYSEIDVACKQIGFQGAYIDAVNNSYSASSLPYGSDAYELHCTGQERWIQQCPRERLKQCDRLAGIQCKVRGGWSLWSGWDECSVTCENGTRTRTRDCNHPPPNYGGTECPGEDTQLKPCTKVMCPIDGVWATWSPWSECDVTCENGTRFRTRACTGPFYNGAKCPGPDNEVEDCFPKMCPVDGVWEDWVPWTECSHTCGYGNRNRSRTCYGPFYEGLDCQGSPDEIETCNAFSCPVDGDWKMWTNWGDCSVTCGGGLRNRTRECIEPEFGGASCVGPAEEAEPCNEHNCPIDGAFSEWELWSECSVTCANGTRFRTRECFGPFFGGANCTGPLNEEEVCITKECPVDGIWDSWQPWQECSVTCGGGRKLRQRVCIGPYFGGAQCEGPEDDIEDCNTHECPVHGVWNPWTLWTDCSTTCENGTRTRNRTCDGPYYDGDDCAGAGHEIENCFLRWCPVDGVWEEWTAWDNCPVSCGGSVQNRTRGCIGPFHDGANCTGLTEESQDCNTDPCPVDGAWTLWSKWNECNVTCGGGTSSRFRFCSESAHGGSNCTGPSEEFRDCNIHECPVDGVWEAWSNWTECTRTCGTGERQRFRDCDGPYYGGANCTGPWDEQETCNTHECPVDGVWKEWASWSACNVTCGGGTRWRSRDCEGPFYGGAECPGHNMSTEACNTHECPVDGVWTDWTGWEECSVTCGGGNQSRFRNCTGPFYGGANCTGAFDETRDCNTFECPIDGVMSQWSGFYACNVTCGGGIQWRNRTCIGPFYGGANCTDPLEDSRDCNSHNCPIDGVYNLWSPWESCDVTCGGGIQWRNRTCDGPYYGGAKCEGPDKQNQTCNDFFCPVDGVWEPWTDWDECSVTCGGAVHSRYRNCTGPFYGGANCSGPAKESRDCNTHHCPVDGEFKTWGSWYECNVTCGGGRQWRNRSCEGPFHGGAECAGPFNDSQACNEQNCPIDGVWEEWQAWQGCSVTCGGGQRLRDRICDGPYYGGEECDGPTQESGECGTAYCLIPGDWFPWSEWTLCTVTCNSGSRYRNRTCDWESYGDLTDACQGPKEEVGHCHTFPCEPLAIHCADWASRGLNQSCIADVDPDGEDSVYGPVQVECDFDTEPGKAVTIIHHDQENTTQVQGYEGAGMYEAILTYTTGWGEAIKIVDESSECAQFMRWDCKAAIIHNPFDPDTLTTFWKNRTEQSPGYFGGATPGSGNCACGETNSCFNTSLPCNCDVNDAVWRFDEGFVTNKAELPIHSFYAGDTGAPYEAGIMTLGPLLCH
ncbi:SCO-spondin-like isoform X2 [Mercenaria mercenaria]|uniref:SCO-spondin-like isoform X2 n=1 Tax=Mercenaria mercenaria TaxID=6596 RepID=UPI00234F218B|nr:SCO-spondin-like isoform X2 [Mercenaria mercenaria]